MSSVLERILDAHRQAARADLRPLGELHGRAASLGRDELRDFRGALLGPGVSVIAELKRRSPSKGPLAPDLIPSMLAKAYEAGGAACLSVLTDAEFFGGSPNDLVEARAACSLPVLRKDFTLSDRDVCDARLMGADAVLLIVVALTDAELTRLRAFAAELGLAALVEVHDEAELDRALAAGADLVGVNQRDLRTFEVDRELAPRLAQVMPRDVVRVAESGVRHGSDLSALAAAGYHAVLVGESLVTATDPAGALRALLGRADGLGEHREGLEGQ